MIAVLIIFLKEARTRRTLNPSKYNCFAVILPRTRLIECLFVYLALHKQIHLKILLCRKIVQGTLMRFVYDILLISLLTKTRVGKYESC